MAYSDLTGTQANALLVAAEKVAVALSPNYSQLTEAPASLLPTYTDGTAAEGQDIDSLISDLSDAVGTAAPAPATQTTVKNGDSVTIDSKKYTFTVAGGKITKVVEADA